MPAEFGSISDVFTTALTEFLANYESRARKLEVLPQSKEVNEKESKGDD